MTEPGRDERLELLVEGYLEGALGPGECRELRERLERAPEQVDAILAGLRTESLLRETLAEQSVPGSSFPVPGSGTTEPATDFGKPRPRPSAAVPDLGLSSAQPGTGNQPLDNSTRGPEPVEGEPGTTHHRRPGWLVPAAAAAALIVVSGLFAFGILPSGNVTIKDFSNSSGRVRSETLADGTKLAIAPGAQLKATGRDGARKVRQLIRLESGEVEVTAPKAAAGEVACRVETPEGLWVETVGTVFKVTRTWENEKGERNVDKSKLTGAAIAAVLLVAVSDGEVRAGSARAEEARVAAGREARVAADSRNPSPAPTDLEAFLNALSDARWDVFSGKLLGAKADWAALPGKTPGLAKAILDFEVERSLRGNRNGKLTLELHYAAGFEKYFLPAGPQPRLAPELLAPATRHLVVAGSGDAKGLVLRILPATDQHVAAVEAALKKLGGEASWGQAVGGLQAGLSAEQAKFEAGKPAELSITLKNGGDKEAKLPLSAACGGWQFVFDGGDPLLAKKAAVAGDPILTAAGGGTQAMAVQVGGPGWTFEYQNQDKPRPALTTLPPGKYKVSARYSHPEHWHLCPYWFGALATGPVEIEIVAAGKPEEKVSWGPVVNGLQAGLSAQPKAFIKRGEAGFAGRLLLDIVVVNNGSEGVAYYHPDCNECFGWGVTFTPKEGGAPVRAVILPEKELDHSGRFELARGDRNNHTVRASFGAPESLCGSEKPKKGAVRMYGREPFGKDDGRAYLPAVPPLPAGKYSVTVSYDDTQGVAFATGPAEIEIVAAGGAGAAALWGEAVNGLQGRIEAEKATVAPGEDIKLTFWLRTGEQQKASLHVWDNIYSNGYRNDAYQVKTPDGKAVLLRRPDVAGWDKNVPAPVEIKPGVPWKLGGWAGQVNVKSLRSLGLDTTQPGTYTITGVYEEAAEAKARGAGAKDVAIWGGKLTTPPIEVKVEAAGAAAAPTFSAKCQRPADRVAADVAGGALVLTVTSPGGIGSAEVKPEKGEWPKKVTVRLALKGLEGFTAECGGKKLSGRLGAGVGKDELAAEKKGEFIEVALAEGFASGKDAGLKLSWVDFYR